MWEFFVFVLKPKKPKTGDYFVVTAPDLRFAFGVTGERTAVIYHNYRLKNRGRGKGRKKVLILRAYLSPAAALLKSLLIHYQDLVVGFKGIFWLHCSLISTSLNAIAITKLLSCMSRSDLS